MKHKAISLILTLILLSSLRSNAQFVTFTRLKSGAITQDEGNSQGSAWADIDNDGYMDVAIGNTSGFNLNHPNLYYRNDKNGNFVRITASPLGTDILNMCTTPSWGDLDNDGDWDLYVPNIWSTNDPARLYLNDGYGNFSRINLDYNSGTTATWVDYDMDGFLDIFIKAQGGNYNILLNNNQDGSFTQINSHPLVNFRSDTQAASWADYDNDGDMDVFLHTFDFSGTYHKSRFFINNDGTFEAMHFTAVLLKDFGSAGGSWGDYDNDGDLDIYVSTLIGTNHLYQNLGNGEFTQITIDPSFALDKGFCGSTWGDFDNDGDLDLFVTGELNDFSFCDLYHGNMLFDNNGDGTFTNITEGDIIDDGGHSCTIADYDNDGDLDILVPNGSIGPPYTNALYTNDGNDNNWIIVSCEGTESNRSAIGVRVKIKATINGTTVWQMRELTSQTGLHSFNSPRLHFGLGDAETIDSLVIRWPLGQVDVYKDVSVNEIYRAIEAEKFELFFTGTNIEEMNESNISLLNIYPNPIRNEVNISYIVEKNCLIDLEIFNIQGQFIYRILSEQKTPGKYSLNWNGRLGQGNKLTPGIYFCRMKNDNLIKEVIRFVKLNE